ncbi:flavodoxin family protein [Cocleimonas sp. KMM 6892]|jgi:multimeric flavodoxin WrbA|uniref:flavodoxin family protein n=1 Tax=unclassified Cocleimonas TaxID=2639732 RepID=UPI002DBFD986|nr:MULTISPECIES: NAD(P)H-dependent oxidoreductase [unclassified Cocleimonas]MEB8432298.1 flavodoxin family protein [Cocleimonas sp. KMM 6892]MEC4714616.1 flavodoxin family protein [Cocleimonas sp. KMM 6895]MEC4744570.1 flavodoxin family protein [Cocleimonas sp. KMM 6896]
MAIKKKLLIVVHTPSANTQLLAEAAHRGASHPDFDSIEVTLTQPLKTTVEDVLECDAILLGTTENFGYMSGAMKDFFDRIYYPCLEKTEALPYAIFIRAGIDGSGTKQAMEKIITGLRWKPVHETLILQGSYQTAFEGEVEELGMTIAAGLDAGIY